METPTTDAATAQPLAGVRVLEIGNHAAAPYAGYLLGLLGAEVVKVEPLTGDPMRAWGAGPDADVSFFFRLCNAGKSSVAVDIKAPSGAALVKALIPGFDVVITNLKTETLAKLGLSGSECLAINDRLVHLVVSGLGANGPMAGRPAFDSVAQAASGFLSVYFENGHVPSELPAIADLSAGLVGAAGVLAGLTSRGITGKGMIVETSLLEALCAMLASAHIHASHTTGPRRLRRAAGAQMFQLETADDHRVAIHLSTSTAFWVKLAEAVGPELLNDDRFATYALRVENFDALTDQLQQRFVERNCDDWEKTLDDADIPFAPIYSMEDAAVQPQVQQLELYDYDDQGRAVHFRGPWLFDGERPQANGHLPTVGEDDTLFSEVLSAEDYARLREEGVIGKESR
jgi:crotonobetainyl-CoA:carnitine CoA-transferase CaiB-like acyl-CoA transferase